jgi:uncharacterized heparinase superfamily protein
MNPAGRLLREARLAIARMSHLRGRVPEGPALPVRDPWPGDPARGARLLRGELEAQGVAVPLAPGAWNVAKGPLGGLAHGFAWLRDLRALGTDAARTRARALVADWIALPPSTLSRRPDVTGSRVAAWLGHYDFVAASADDAFRARLMARLVADAHALAAALPPEAQDERGLTALRGLIAAAVALPDQQSLMQRALRFLPHEVARQVLPDGCHVERSPAAQLAALQDLAEIRTLLHASQIQSPAALGAAIERMAPALRALRHGDGGLALFNGAKEEQTGVIDLVLAQAGRGGRAPPALPDGGFHRLQAGRTVLIADCGAPPPRGADRLAHAGTLAFELSIGRERLITNCGGAPLGDPAWHDAARATAAHSTLVIADTNSSELRPEGLGRRPGRVEAQRQEANGAHWLEAHHDGYAKPFGAIHRRRLYVSENGEDVRGEDQVEAREPRPFAVRFHLHPHVRATMQGETVLLRLPGGASWQVRADGALPALEESVYLGGTEVKRTEQLVLATAPASAADQPQQVRWAITRTG